MAPPEYGTTTSSGPTEFTRRGGENAPGEPDGGIARDTADVEHHVTWEGQVHKAAEFHTGQASMWGKRASQLDEEARFAHGQAEAHQHAASALQDVISSHDPRPRMEAPVASRGRF